MNDTELFALSVLVQSSRLAMRSADEQRLACGNSVGYGDAPANGEIELEAELRRRCVLQPLPGSRPAFPGELAPDAG